MARVVCLDTETWPIAPGLLAPPIVCVQWQADNDPAPRMLHREHARAVIESWLDSDVILVGHNIAFDMAAIAAQWPDLLPTIFAKYDRDEITDTLIRDQLLMIARGCFRSVPTADGTDVMAVKYSLGDCVFRHFNERLPKEGWRLFYRVFDRTPDVPDWESIADAFRAECAAGRWPEWAGPIEQKHKDALLMAHPSEAVRYALDDPRWTLRLYQRQEAIAMTWRAGGAVLADQYRQARAAFALHLSSCWGVYTDPDAVDALGAKLEEEYVALEFSLQLAGIVRKDGTADTKAAQAAMVAACAEARVAPFATKKGAVSLSAEACARFSDENGDPLPDAGPAAEAVANYSRFLTIRKMLRADVKMLRAGCEYPVQPRYDLADTGRTRASKPNIQAINRGAGIRECFRPRPGKVFAQADYEGLELHTLAAWCLEKIGWSRLAESLNAGQDAHLVMAAEFLGITYEQALVRKKADDKEVNDARQAAKAVNFGLPGRLGAKKLARYAKNNYNVDMTEAEAAQRKEAWLRRFPEMITFFQMAAQATAGPDQSGTEEHVFVGRWRGNTRCSALCNGRFQGLGADAAKEALWRVTKACYTAGNPLFGARVVAFVHDEVILETDDGSGAPHAAEELGRLMKEGANIYLGKCPVRLEPLLMRVWSKKAKPVHNADGVLIPWEPDGHQQS